jgi:acetyl esterase/lipase
MRTLPYGPHPEQVGDLYLPAGPGPHPVVVLFHGGGFGAEYGRDMLAPAAADLARRGVAAWNVTYRRCGCGGGWPETFDDARTALQAPAALDAALDLGEVSVLGFSAGAAPALHAARAVHGEVVPRRAVILAGLTMLEAAARARGAEAGAYRLLGDPDERPEAYAGADPARHLPLGVPHLHVHGEADTMIPIAMTEAYLAAARAAGDDEIELVRVPGAEHMDVASPRGPAWEAVVRRVAG